MNLTTSEMTKIGIALGVLFGVYKFVHNPMVKAAALGVMGTIVAKQLPYIGDALN